MTGQGGTFLNHDYRAKMSAPISFGAPGFALNAPVYNQMRDRVGGAEVPELLYQVLAGGALQLVGDYQAAGLVEHDSASMYKGSVGALGEKGIAGG